MTTLKKLEELIYKGFKETGERFKETERLWKESRKESEERWKQTWQETDRRIERMHQQITKELNGVTESLSRFSEQTVFPATQRLFSKRGIQLDRLKKKRRGYMRIDGTWHGSNSFAKMTKRLCFMGNTRRLLDSRRWT